MSNQENSEEEYPTQSQQFWSTGKLRSIHAFLDTGAYPHIASHRPLAKVLRGVWNRNREPQSGFHSCPQRAFSSELFSPRRLLRVRKPWWNCRVFWTTLVLRSHFPFVIHRPSSRIPSTPRPYLHVSFIPHPAKLHAACGIVEPEHRAQIPCN
jgi:hypothetical protein